MEEEHHSRTARERVSTRWVGFGLLLVAVTFAWWLSRDETDPTAPWEEMAAAEEAIVELGPALARMSASVENLQVPDAQARRLFADSVAIVDIAGPRNGEELAAGAVQGSRPALSGPPLSVARQALDLWRGLLGNASLFEYAAFRVVRG
ncbi:MAG: hypothetical protein VYE81_09970, partial [Planctomycetota bacterium]|nr:hypothetical protein [Planctomycetota bacterium]